MRCRVPLEQPELRVPLGISINRVGLILIIPEVKIQGSVCLPGTHAMGTGCFSCNPHNVLTRGFLAGCLGRLLTPPSEAVARAAAGKADEVARIQPGTGFLPPRQLRGRSDGEGGSARCRYTP